MPFVDTDGARVAWESTGPDDAPTVLLIQGLGYPGAMWYRIVPLLADAHRVITLDNRGTGATGVPPGPYSIESMADDAAAVLTAAGVSAAHVVAISMGGPIAQELTLRHPDKVLSLTLVSTHAGGTSLTLPEPEVLALLAKRSDLPPEESARATIHIGYSPDAPRDRIEEDIAQRLANWTTAEGYTNQLMGASMWGGAVDRLGSIGVPVQIIHGRADMLVPVANAHAIAELIPTARVQILEGIGHVLFTEAPDELATAIRDLVATTSNESMG